MTTKKGFPAYIKPGPVDPNRIYKFSEVCELLQISDTTLRRWIRVGNIRATRFGREWRFLGSQLLATFERGQRRS